MDRFEILRGEPVKRRFMYIMKPQEYGVECDKCGGSNLDWSEWAGLIWCYDCQIDTKGDTMGSLFSGPVPMAACEVLGISFDRIDIRNGKRLICGTEEWSKSL